MSEQVDVSSLSDNEIDTMDDASLDAALASQQSVEENRNDLPEETVEEHQEINNLAEELSTEPAGEPRATPKPHEQEERNIKNALVEERNKRKDWQSKYEALQQELEQAKSKHNAQPVQDDLGESNPNSFDDDPLGYLKQRADALEEMLNQNQLTASQQAQANMFAQRCTQDVSIFNENHDDFQDAYNFHRRSRVSEYETAGYTKEQAQQLADQFEQALAEKAIQDGANVAERLYNISKNRGYSKDQNAALQKLNKIKSGQQASKSLSSVGGVTQSDVTEEMVLNTSDPEEFDRLWEKLRPKTEGIY